MGHRQLAAVTEAPVFKGRKESSKNSPSQAHRERQDGRGMALCSSPRVPSATLQSEHSPESCLETPTSRLGSRSLRTGLDRRRHSVQTGKVGQLAARFSRGNEPVTRVRGPAQAQPGGPASSRWQTGLGKREAQGVPGRQLSKQENPNWTAFTAISLLLGQMDFCLHRGTLGHRGGTDTCGNNRGGTAS